MKRKNTIHLDAITVSIDYSDILEKVVTNRHILDRWLIVTHESDYKTIEVCRKYDLEYTTSDRVYSNFGFCKGKAINDGIEYLKPSGWLLHIDSDILLPDNFYYIISEMKLNPEYIYGCNRCDLEGNIINDTSPEGFQIDSYKMGFIQLWNTSEFNNYVEESHDTTTDDTLHMSRFKGVEVLPVTVTHIDKYTNMNFLGRGIHGNSRRLRYGYECCG